MGEGTQGPQQVKEAPWKGRLGGIRGQHGLAHPLPAPPSAHPDWKGDGLRMATEALAGLDSAAARLSFISPGS